MRQLNAAFDALGDDLTPAELHEMTAAMTYHRYLREALENREAIKQLAKDNRVQRLYLVEESDDPELRLDGTLCYLVEWEPDYAMPNYIRLYKGLEALHSQRSNLIDWEDLDEQARDAMAKQGALMWTAT